METKLITQARCLANRSYTRWKYDGKQKKGVAEIKRTKSLELNIYHFMLTSARYGTLDVLFKS